MPLTVTSVTPRRPAVCISVKVILPGLGGGSNPTAGSTPTASSVIGSTSRTSTVPLRSAMPPVMSTSSEASRAVALIASASTSRSTDRFGVPGAFSAMKNSPVAPLIPKVTSTVVVVVSITEEVRSKSTNESIARSTGNDDIVCFWSWSW